MKILFDQGTPFPLARHLKEHSIDTVHKMGWFSLSNGLLLESAEKAGYELLITTHQNLRYQQNLTGRRTAILVLLSTSWPRIQLHLNLIQKAVGETKIGSYKEIPI
jgi:hypothetical protein